LWLAGRHKLAPTDELYQPNPLPIKGVISLAGIPDLEDSIFRGVCGGAAADLVEGVPGTHRERYKQASIINLVPLGVPQIFIQGGQDFLVPKSSTDAYLSKLGTAARAEITYQPFPSAGHFEIAYPPAVESKSVIDGLKKFLAKP